jgi:hypothetical protein
MSDESFREVVEEKRPEKPIEAMVASTPITATVMRASASEKARSFDFTNHKYNKNHI